MTDTVTPNDAAMLSRFLMDVNRSLVMMKDDFNKVVTLRRTFLILPESNAHVTIFQNSFTGLVEVKRVDFDDE